MLYFQRCRWCHTATFRRLLCPVCGSTDMAEERSDGTGVIHHVTVVGRSAGRPRAMAIIDMREGFRIRARVSAVPLARACVGAQVRLGFGPQPQEIAFQLCD
ncbi:Zn-ribbon domain-containing OB-fold protein [Streptomyces rhizosphaericus]|uniref:Zn-ribbon domain-containing OB-fold protein n=1 Tax=Streptomyces rhizosphaericus TaxID=114699 RepID=UPI00142D5072